MLLKLHQIFCFQGAIDTASSMSDLSVFVDLMNVLVLKP